MSEILCGNASDNLFLTFKGGCRGDLTYKEAYRCTGCGGRFHKDCILEHFKLEEAHDWGRQEERKKFEALLAKADTEGIDLPTERPNTNNRPVRGANDAPKKEGTQ